MPKNAPNSNRTRRTLGVSVGVAMLVLACLLLQPVLERDWGWQLPPASDLPGESGAPTQPTDGGLHNRVEQASSNAADSLNSKVEPQPPGKREGLNEVAPDVFESAAGLRYGPGSREGHRLKHILLHIRDQPERPGSHGVFDGGRETTLALLDEAYRLAQKRGPPVRMEAQGSRTVYTVDMNRRVGFVGGQTGQRRNHPACRHVRLVLEGRNVITAFPLAL